MQILLAVIYGAAIGAIAHYTMPARDTRGVALMPLVGAVAGGAIWTILTWAGLSTDNAWLWIAGFVVPTVAAYGGLALITAARHAHDAHERERLAIA
ncbi:hypothetical protein [Microbacterium terrisoli]|jgi:uncharacterized membrane protein YeaQ/YmgE (transglycosylase-associated protein family)|uniref:hypothetical protein n=1 Tax=Microbacterium terrisoli TaxID=3242192 RepID=UPI0028040169|nr:hypothetical protein [Microbacterium protaetiae]